LNSADSGRIELLYLYCGVLSTPQAHFFHILRIFLYLLHLSVIQPGFLPMHGGLGGIRSPDFTNSENSFVKIDEFS
jgi:hypothetical protein